MSFLSQTKPGMPKNRNTAPHRNNVIPVQPISHTVRINDVLRQRGMDKSEITGISGMWANNHKFNLVRRGDNYKWEYCQLCARTRAKLKVPEYQWVRDGLNIAKPILISQYDSVAAIKMLEDAMVEAYNVPRET